MEKLFLFHCPAAEEQKINQVARTLKISCAIVSDADYSKTLGAIASGKADSPATPFSGTIPADSLLLFCGLSDKRMDKLLFALKQAQVSVDFKTVLTPTNQNWTVQRLLLEMHKEKAAWERQTR
jgi:aryl carrier-like protein